ncbi:hypothetical protein LCGC14_1781280, partial [marine sediment metagenome]
SITGAGQWEVMSLPAPMAATIDDAYLSTNPGVGFDEAWQRKTLNLYSVGSIYDGTITSMVKFKLSGNLYNSEVLIRCSQGGPTGVVGRSMGVILRGSGSSGYVIDFLNTRFLQIGKVVNGVYAGMLSEILFTTVTGENRYIRVKIEDNTKIINKIPLVPCPESFVMEFGNLFYAA